MTTYQNNQKVFTNLLIVGIVIVVITIVGHFVWRKHFLSSIVPTTQQAATTNIGDTSNWQIYTNAQYGFEMKLPPSWQGYQATVHTYDARGSYTGDVCFSFSKPHAPLCVIQIAVFTPKQWQDFKDSFAKDNMPQPSYLAKNDQFYFNSSTKWTPDCTNSDLDKFQCERADEVDQILSTFKFTEPVANNSSCVRDQEAVPVIAGVSNETASVGDTLTIHGCNFLGFEGDKNVWIENSNGVKGVLYGTRNEDNENIQFTLKSPVCEQDNSYSGLPCQNSLTLAPGVYKLYVIPWGKKSNEVNITIK